MTHGFCAECGAAMELAPLGGKSRPRCGRCGFVRWRNPAPVGMALIEHCGKLVLIRRDGPPLANYWAPPAGYVESGESVTDAVIREAEEECGLRIALGELVGVYSQADVDVLIIAYAAQSVGGSLIAGDDAADAVLVEPERLPTQPPPVDGTATDIWLHGVIEAVLADWQTRTQLTRRN